jgi:hypothetical protein
MQWVYVPVQFNLESIVNEFKYNTIRIVMYGVILTEEQGRTGTDTVIQCIPLLYMYIQIPTQGFSDL